MGSHTVLRENRYAIMQKFVDHYLETKTSSFATSNF